MKQKYTIKNKVKSHKGRKSQKGGQFGRKDDPYNAIKEFKKTNRPVKLLSYKKISSPNSKQPSFNRSKFSSKQLNEFEILRNAALEARKANGIPVKKPSPHYNALYMNNNNNNGYYGNESVKERPVPPKRTYFPNKSLATHFSLSSSNAPPPLPPPRKSRGSKV